MIEKRRYKVTSFKEVSGCSEVRVLLSCADAVRLKPEDDKIGIGEMMKNPGGVAQKLMSQQVEGMVRDTFLISRAEYDSKKYDIGDHVIVTIEKE